MMDARVIGERSDAVLRTAIGERSDAVLRTAIGERSDAVLRTAVRERDEFEQLGVVVEHLFEMRRKPTLVNGIAREAAAEMIVDTALADALERKVHGREVAR